MDSPDLVVRLGHGSHRLPDALPDVLTRAAGARRRLRALLICSAVFAAYNVLAAQPGDPHAILTLDSLRAIPVPGPITIHPRVFAAYGALIAAAMLSLL